MLRIFITALLIVGLLVAPVAADDPEPEPEGPTWWAALLSQLLLNPITAPVAAPVYAIAGAWAYENQEQAVELIQTVVDTSGEGTNSILDVLNRIAEIIIGGLRSILNFIGAIVDAVGAIIQLVGLALEAIFGFIGKVWGWIGQAIDLFFQVLRSIIESPPQQIPGLPRCVSAPTQYEVCAIWYIFDWTVFADNTPGAMLIPLMVLIIDIGIAYYVVRSVFRVVKQFQSQLGDG